MSITNDTSRAARISGATKIKAVIATLAVSSLVACGSLALASESASSDAEVEGADETTSAITVTADDIQTYCGMCHFTNVENASINSWNQTNIDRAMVESMVPMLDDDTIDAITDYFAQIEPAEEEAE